MLGIEQYIYFITCFLEKNAQMTLITETVKNRYMNPRALLVSLQPLKYFNKTIFKDIHTH